MKTVLISLVGGRPLPNIVLSQHVQPDNHYLIVSRDSVGAGRDYEKTLAALPPAFAPKDTFVVAPYDLHETIDACQKIFAQHPNDRIIINTTLGPKTMAFGAYDAGKTWHAQGADIEVCYLARDQLVCLFANQADQRVQIGLEAYCASYGWQGNWKTAPGDERLAHLAMLLSKNIECTMALLQILRSNDRGKGKRTCKSKEFIPEPEFGLLTSLEALGLVSNVRHEAQGTVWTILDQSAGELLLSGDWLEYLVYTHAGGLKLPSGAQLLSEYGWGLEDAHRKGEIDFAGLYQGQLIIASCKTRPELRREWFEELRAKMDQLGKGMCSGMLVSTISRASRKPTELADYQKWAQINQIVLVLAEDVPNLPAILRKVALVQADLDPPEIAVYPRI